MFLMDSLIAGSKAFDEILKFNKILVKENKDLKKQNSQLIDLQNNYQKGINCTDSFEESRRKINNQVSSITENIKRELEAISFQLEDVLNNYDELDNASEILSLINTFEENLKPQLSRIYEKKVDKMKDMNSKSTKIQQTNMELKESKHINEDNNTNFNEVDLISLIKLKDHVKKQNKLIKTLVTRLGMSGADQIVSFKVGEKPQLIDQGTLGAETNLENWTFIKKE